MRSAALISLALFWGLFACPLEAAEQRERPSRLTATALVVSVQNSYTIEPLAANVYAAIARPGSNATTNALFIIGRDYVIAAGAHMSREAINDLNAAIAARTSKPVRYFILAHHHSGYTNIDFDFPPGQDVLMTWQTWRSIDAEVRDPQYPLVFFNDGLTLRPGGLTVILTNVGKGHTDGDMIVYIPEADVVFASDLLYVDSVGYMASGHMTDWLLALDFIEQLGAEQVVPGYGPVSSVEEVFEFGQYFRDFLTAVLQHIERGDSLEKTIAEFDLPQHRNKDGYEQLIKLNLQRAYHDLKTSFGR